jgi:2-dehydropantoate 2-reductase
VQHYGFTEAAAFLGPRVGGATVLVFNNLWVDPLTATEHLPADQVAWGFPGAGGGFGDDGVLRGALLPVVFFGSLDRPPTERERAVRQVFREAGFRIQENSDFRGWLLVHFVQNAGLHTQSLKLGSLSELTSGNVREAILAIRELLPLVEARGVDLRRHRIDLLPFTAPVWLAAPALAWLFGHFPPMRVVMEAHANPEELRAVCRDTLAEARRLGVKAPRLEAAEPYFAGRRTV